jgi:hypothetical protein
MAHVSANELQELAKRITALETRYGITDEAVTDDSTEWFPIIAGYTRIRGTRRYAPTETEDHS